MSLLNWLLLQDETCFEGNYSHPQDTYLVYNLNWDVTNLTLGGTRTESDRRVTFRNTRHVPNVSSNYQTKKWRRPRCLLCVLWKKIPIMYENLCFLKFTPSHSFIFHLRHLPLKTTLNKNLIEEVITDSW